VFDPWRTATTYADAVATRLLPADAWRRRQSERLQRLLHDVSERSAWWRDRLAPARQPGGGFSLDRVPVSRKLELMAHFGDWVTDPRLDLASLRRFSRDRAELGDAFEDRFVVWESSGSSGEPALFVQDAASMAVFDAVEAARGPAALLDPGTGLGADLRLAFVGAIDGPFASIVALQRLRRLNPWMALHAHAFSFLQPVQALVAQLEDWRPSVLSTYPSLAWMLAQEQRAGRLHLQLKAVWTGGESLTPAVRQTVARAFGCPVRNSYGASECLAIGFDCTAGALHLNADWVVLEPADASGRASPAGHGGGTALLTNLANAVQPIIRYDLGDRVRILDGSCRCGSALPRIEVQGRSDAVLTLRDTRGHAVHLAPLALTTVLEEEGGVFDFCLHQRGPQALALDLYGAAREHRGKATRALQRMLELHGAAPTRLQVRCHAAAPQRGRSGKQPRIVRDERGGLSAPVRRPGARTSASPPR
jgi:phenylacetate-CoA ligase